MIDPEKLREVYKIDLARIEALREQNRLRKEAIALGGQLSKTISSGFDQWIQGAETFREAMDKLWRQLVQIAANFFLRQALNSLFGLGGPVLPKAAGGPVAAGQLYRVGESGEELFRPWASGEIIPNQQLRPALAGGGGMVHNWSIHIESTDGPGVRRALGEAMPLLEERASRVAENRVAIAQSRPSPLSRSRS